MAVTTLTNSATTTIQRSGQAVQAALSALSPPEAEQFRREYRDALTRAADTFDLTEAERVLTRWWGIAHLRANPLTADEQQLVQRFRAGEDVGWSSLAAYLAARGPATPWVPDYILGWVDIAIEQYLALPTTQQRLIDTRIQQLLNNPAGSGAHRVQPPTYGPPQTPSAQVSSCTSSEPIDPRLVIMRLVY